ncbi:hypothetical protein AWB79_04935 [Caballeronia hypogeia]|uniref:Uncharacterized protein n=1 Tax=Caballeronia hypogeia TaxID=1777140 RepID=A0A158C8U1_9BURK|nr:hypothetical protein [Caballeronia hypogeia]SAK78702.1 hypothetical protein AWB79_04935 [Caballeronia hypogeia]
MSELLAGALCVFVALSAGASLRAGAIRSRVLWEIGAVVIIACGVSGGMRALAPGGIALLLVALAGFASYRSGRAASNSPASTQALLATIAVAACLLPQAHGAQSVMLLLAGGALAAAGRLASPRVLREDPNHVSFHLACAGACAALAYVFGAQSGALAVLPVLALISLIGAHLALAIGGGAGAPVASVMSGAGACGLALALTADGSHAVLVVAAVALAVGCSQEARGLRRVSA